MDLLNPVPGGDLPYLLDLGRGDHTGRHAEPDNTVVRVTFRDDTSTGKEVLVHRATLTSYHSINLFGVLTDRCYHRTNDYSIYLPIVYI